jgi:predicted lipoprotein with Yx(FWY)xxD motif
MTTNHKRVTVRRPRAAACAALAAGPLVVGAAALLATPSVATAATQGKPLVHMAKVAKYGEILENSAGLPLYMDTANKPGKWACTGSCLTAWPPLTLPKGTTKVKAAAGVTGLGTVKGPSGLQVTWHGKPLYTFVRDSKGKVNGQGIGHVWYVIQVSAKAAKAGSVTSTTAGSSWA